MLVFVHSSGSNGALRAVATLAGSGSASAVNGIGTGASFNSPYGIAVDASGSFLYVADRSSHRIRVVTVASGLVATLAGSGAASFSNGVGIAATFNSPNDIVLDTMGKAFIADQNNHRIRQIVLASGAVSTLAGSGASSFANGVGTNARFSFPLGVAIDSSGSNLFVADSSNNLIRQIAIASATVSTLAGSGSQAFANGIGTLASFWSPTSVVFDAARGSILVADMGNERVRQVMISTSSVTTLAGSGTRASTDSVSGATAAFSSPVVVAIDASSGSLIVTEASQNRLRQVDLVSTAVTTLVGTVDFNVPRGIAVSPTTGTIFVSETGANRIRTLQSVPKCLAGFYCPAGSSQPRICDQGTYCPTAGMTATGALCPAGYFCSAGASAPMLNQCQPGTFCVAGSAIAAECAPGSFGPAAGNQIASACLACSGGFYCNAAGLSAVSGVCDPGFACPNGTISQSIVCPAGSACPAQSAAPVLCAPGSYQDQAAQAQCLPAVAGFYAPAPGTVALVPCPAGSFCGANSITPQPCAAGSFSNATNLAAQSACSSCPASMFCGASGLTAPSGFCSAGYLCIGGGATVPNPADAKCPAGSYCEAAAVSATACPFGTFAAATGGASIGDCTPCTAGNYCNQRGLSTPVGPCDAGFYCTSGSNTSRPIGGAAFGGDQCPAGAYCLSGSAPLGTLCAPGRFNPSIGMSACSLCSAGFYCPSVGNIADSTLSCPIGYYCPSGSALPTSCPAGSYGARTQLQNASDCSPCPIGSYCAGANLTAVTALCPAGVWCNLGTATPQPTGVYPASGPCPAGFYCTMGMYSDHVPSRLSVFLSVCLSVSPPVSSFSLSLYVFLTLSPSFSLCVFLSLTLTHPLFLFLSNSPSLFLFLSFYCLSFSLCLSLSL